MLTEMRGKAGNVCRQAKEGQLHCPLIVRPTSEDVVIGQFVQAIRAINAYWWLPDLLNTALGERRFRRQMYRRLRIEPWVNKPPYPRELLPWNEGSTQVDVEITWENPPTTIFIEGKYGSGLAPGTANSQGEHGYPADQLIRNARVGLLEAGYFHEGCFLFDMPRRDFAVILLAPRRGHPLVQRYRDPRHLRASIPSPHRLKGLPPAPFIGEISFQDIATLLRGRAIWLTRAERRVLEDLVDYLQFKSSMMPAGPVQPYRFTKVTGKRPVIMMPSNDSSADRNPP